MAERQAPPRRSGDTGRQPTVRRNDVIRCENCGEDYSTTYKRCPFCDERPGRGYVGGKRVSNTRGGGYGGPVNPIQIVGLVISLILIITALFIVFRFVGAPLFGGEDKSSAQSSGSTPGSSAVDPGSSSGGQPGGSSASDPGDGSQSEPDDPQPSGVQSITLSKEDVTLNPGEHFSLTAVLSPAGAEGTVTWTSSDPSVATVDELGIVTNVNSTGTKTAVTITAASGDATAQCIVRCVSSGGGTGTGTGTGGNTGPVTPNTPGTIVNAELGLNIRSGPGSSYDVVASASNGAKVTILGEENGWYKIVYSGNQTGYVSKDYVSVG